MQPKVTGVPETFLIPLWARAVETNRPGGMIRDPKAVEMMARIDYDFSKFQKAQMSQTGVSIRTMLLDNAAKAYIAKNPNAVIVNLGAGLDARFLRVDNGQILWYDLDLPESIEVRRKFFVDSERCKMIAKSVFDYTWIDDIGRPKAPVLLIAEGLLMYFEEAEIKGLFAKLKSAFSGGEMLFESISAMMSKNTKRHDAVTATSAVFKWGVDSGRAVEALTPGLKVLHEWSLFKYLPNGRGNWIMRAMAAIPLADRKLSNRIFQVQL